MQFKKVFLIKYLFDYLSFIKNNENMRNEMKNSFSVRGGGNSFCTRTKT